MMNRNKNTETITTITDKKGNIFRTDASFNPATVDEICIEFMANYCISRGTEDVEWLKAEALKKSSHTRNIKDYETG